MAETLIAEKTEVTRPASAYGPAVAGAPAVKRQIVCFSFYKVMPEWRRLLAAEKAAHKAEFAEVLRRWNKPGEFLSLTYSTVGTRGDVDMCVWSIGYGVDELNKMRGELIGTALGGYLNSPHNFLAMTKRSQYQIDRPDESEGEGRGAIRPGGQKYIFIYPFWKTRPWYLLSAAERKRLMDEHIRIGMMFPRVKLNTTYSFGIDDQEFVVAFETNFPEDFLDLVQQLRETEISLYTLEDTPIFFVREIAAYGDAGPVGVAMVTSKPAKGLTPPQRLTAAERKAAVEGVGVAEAHEIAAGEPVFARLKSGRTKKPLAPERVAAILDALAKTYPGVVCALVHRNAFELTIATILSAQTTDVGVNKVTPELFRLFPTPQALAEASAAEVEGLIKATGFFRNKAKSIQGAARVLVERFGGEVPETMEEMLELPGVARKTANVVLGSWYGIAVGVVVDTHVLRLSRRLELTTNDDPVKVEADLMKVIPRERRIAFSHELIHHGRQICVARTPKCADCTLERICNSGDKTWSSH